MKIDDQELLGLVHAGCTYGQMSDRLSVSRQAIQNKAKKLGVAEQIKRPPKKAKSPSAASVNYSMPENEIRPLVKNGATGMFCRQRSTAKQRGIAWNLSFPEWWAIWVDSGKWMERGRSQGKYVMARNRDSGPYELGNVFICTHSQNIKDANRWRRQEKLDKGAR